MLHPVIHNGRRDISVLAGIRPIESRSLERNRHGGIYLMYLLLTAYRACGDGWIVEILMLRKVVAAGLASVVIVGHLINPSTIRKICR